MVSIGTAMGSTEEFIGVNDDFLRRGIRAISPVGVQKAMPNAAAAAVGLERGAKAGILTPVSACASGAEAIALAWRNIVLGEADMAICGGVETKIEAVPIAAFCNQESAVDQQRRSGRRVPTIRQEPRRLCLRRSRRADGDRNRGARKSARRQHHWAA